jgi:Sulfotransferase domain
MKAKHSLTGPTAIKKGKKTAALKVIGAGMPCTGTFSLKTALEKLLGGRCYHASDAVPRPEHIWLWHKAAHGEMPDWDFLYSGYVAAVDMPTALFWPELMKAFPDALIVLSIRSAESWLKSFKNVALEEKGNFDRRDQFLESLVYPLEWRAMLHALRQSRLPFRYDKNLAGPAFIEGYEQHNTRVRENVPANRLLVWQEQDGWAPICQALNLPVPSEPFPDEDTTRKYQKDMGQMKGRAFNSTPSLKISFCTSCFHRLSQLQQTFDANVKAIAGDSDTEWVILNYNSTGDLDDFMMARLPNLPRRIIYARDRIQRPWHSSVAKNMAHRLASGDVLMNLDCDNYIGDAIEVIRSGFARGYQMIHLFGGRFGDGTFGRIAMAKDSFYSLGGYDESFHPMGYQDGDLVHRATASGIRGFTHRCPKDMAIENSKEESIRNCPADGLSWADYEKLNCAKSASNISAKRFKANEQAAWAAMDPEIFAGALSEAP